MAKLSVRSETPVDGAFCEGQYLSLMLPDGNVRSFSYATRCQGDGRIELHVRLHPEGKFSNWLKTTLKPGDLIDAIGPFGDCTWQQDMDAGPALMLATGTGIAPLKAIIETVLRKTQRPIWLYWGGRCSDELYMDADFRDLDASEPLFHYRPVLSVAQEGWAGAVGYVQELALADHAGSELSRVYACGSPAMVESARAQFVVHLGLHESRFLCDAFEPSSPTGNGASRNAPESLITLNVRDSLGELSVIQAPSGENLKSVLQNAGLVKGVCGGRQSCGTCRIQLSSIQFLQLAAPQKAEMRLLQALPESGPFDRLSCQLHVDAWWHEMQIVIPPQAW
ncbi:FAD-binding oxidoreductase [Burkholderia sp. PAMC 26561]|uniref:FAD-binding oxidoreductase n=1 Tax=Burkholderia sp. PAMC 26561 TaxID=1795043 RepID=UPI0013C49ED7|nr:flavin reductase family protein [Burkholderia sp. PAMC 26561]